MEFCIIARFIREDRSNFRGAFLLFKNLTCYVKRNFRFIQKNLISSFRFHVKYVLIKRCFFSNKNEMIPYLLGDIKS